MTAKDHAGGVPPNNRKDPSEDEGSKQAVTTIIPSTQIREKLGNIELSITDKRLKEVISARDLDEILSLFKAELNQLIEDIRSEKDDIGNHDRETSSITPKQIDAFNQALDLAKQVIVKRIKELEG